MAPKTVDVLVPVALDRAYTYRVPAGLSLAPGDVVAVPLGPNEYAGVVWGEGDPRPGLHNKLKDVDAKLDVPPLLPELRQFIDWVADYTLGARGTVLNMALRMSNVGPARERVGVRLVGPEPKRMTAARARVLKLVSDQMVRTKAEIAQEAGVSAGVIDGLIDEGTLETLVLPPEPVAQVPDPDHVSPELTQAQGNAAEALVGAVNSGGFSAWLIDGVTGSGKTEVYFEAVAENIRKKRQTLILMPEIALTTQFLNRFEQRFGVRPAEWHSQLPPRKRARTWQALSCGELSVIVGARSALFLPYSDL
ncbi:MAG: DEAD/DEAH box helicase, partial [Pseudorhodoplanes sp.]